MINRQVKATCVGGKGDKQTGEGYLCLRER